MGSWGAYMQPGFNEEIDALGGQLSVEIGCPVHYPAYGKNLFECKCGVIFPVYVVKFGDWNLIRDRHMKERRLAKV